MQSFSWHSLFLEPLKAWAQFWSFLRPKLNGGDFLGSGLDFELFKAQAQFLALKDFGLICQAFQGLGSIVELFKARAQNLCFLGLNFELFGVWLTY